MPKDLALLFQLNHEFLYLKKFEDPFSYLFNFTLSENKGQKL
jgi:hypothetical protein